MIWILIAYMTSNK